MTRDEVNELLKGLCNINNDLSLLHKSGINDNQKRLIKISLTSLYEVEDKLTTYKKTLPTNTLPPKENTEKTYPEHIEDPKQDALDSFNQLPSEQEVDNS